jgi:hypothetical protein
MKRKSLSVALFIFTAVQPLWAARVRLTTTRPKDGSQVPSRACIEGTVSDPSAHVFAIIRPLQWADYYVQKEADVKADGSFKILAYFGEPTTPDGTGFSFRIVANPAVVVPLHDGLKLPGFPAGAGLTDIVNVARSSAPDETCGAPAPLVRSVLPPTQSSPTESAQAAITLSWSVWLRWFGIFCLGLLLVLTALPARTSMGCSVLEAAIGSAWTWWRRVFQRARDAVEGNASKTSGLAAGTPLSVWNNCGNSLTFFDYILHSVRWPLLFTFFVVAFYADARAIAPGLRLLFPRPQAANLALFANSSASTHTATGIATRLFQPFATLWLADSFSVCLALIQAGLGMLILNQYASAESLAMGLWRMLKKCPICSAVFLIFDAALTIIAANRGYESSGPGDWRIPASVAALLALSMPFASSFCLELATHSFAHVAAPPAAGLAAGGFYFAHVAIPAIRVRVHGFVCVFLVTLCAALWSVFCGVPYFYLLLAAVLGEFAQKVMNSFRGDTAERHQSRERWDQGTQDSFGD